VSLSRFGEIVESMTLNDDDGPTPTTVLRIEIRAAAEGLKADIYGSPDLWEELARHRGDWSATLDQTRISLRLPGGVDFRAADGDDIEIMEVRFWPSQPVPGETRPPYGWDGTRVSNQ